MFLQKLPAMGEIYARAPFSPSMREIRLVTIESGNFTDEIRCSLKVVPLDAAGDYETLSYTWGDPTVTERIRLGGSAFNVTSNLADALRHLRNKEDPRIIWIDAICINQADIAERNTQVQMMRSIYSNTSVMNAWLGREDSESELAMAFLESFRDVMNQDKRVGSVILENQGNLNETVWTDTAIGKFILDSSAPSSPNRRGWEAFVHLLDRPYFRRCWVLQEICVSKHIDFWCGNFYFGGLNLRVLVELMIKVAMHPQEKPHPPAIGQGAKDMFMLRGSWEANGHLNLHIILDASTHLEATDRRDRIFAMLGLVNCPPGDQIQPDYNKPAQDVFKEVTRTLMTREDGVDSLSLILSRPKNHGVENGLPSWVSDWGPMPTMPLLEGGHSRDIYSASGKSTAQLSFSEDLDVLYIRGFCFDSLQMVSGKRVSIEVELYTIIPKDWVAIATAYASVWWRGSKAAVSRTDRLDALARTMIADRDFGDFAGTCRAPDSLKDQLRVFTTGGKPPDDWMPGEDSTIRGFKYCVPLLQSLNTCTHERQMFISKQGYVGLVPPAARPGDLLCVFLGVRVPIVLRKVEDHYVLIGESYVDGAMDGQLMKELEEGKSTLESLNIH